jgi:antitoxin component YwqK of YwqJK toxin-antitoxin module
MDSNKQNRVGITAQTKLFDHNGVIIAEYKSNEVYFDDNGNKIQEIEFAQDGAITVKKLFDHQGLVTQALYFDQDQQLSYQYQFSYNPAGKETEREMLSANGQLHKKKVYIYDNQQQIKQAIWYDSKGAIEVIDEYQYQQAPAAVIITRGEVAQWTNCYDQDGRMVSSTGGYWSEDQLCQTHFIYDQQGRLTQKDQIIDQSIIASSTHFVHHDLSV